MCSVVVARAGFRSRCCCLTIGGWLGCALPAPVQPRDHYRKLRRTAEKADARTTLPCTSMSVGTETRCAVEKFINDRTAETGVPGPR